MKAEKLKQLRAAGWRAGSARDFLQLSDEEAALVELARFGRAEPARQPAARSRFNFSAFIALFLASHDRLIAFQSGHANVDYLFGCRSRRLGEHFENDYGVVVDVVHHAPCSVLIRDSQFVAAWTYRRHRPRMRKLDLFAALKPAQETAGFNTRGHISIGSEIAQCVLHRMTALGRYAELSA